MKIENEPTSRTSYLEPVKVGRMASLADPRLKEKGVLKKVVVGSLARSAPITVAGGLAALLIGAPHGPKEVTVHGVQVATIALAVAMTIMMAAFLLGLCRKAVVEIDKKTMNSAKSRILDLINDGYGVKEQLDRGHFARTVICNHDDWIGGRDLVMKLDAIAIQHLQTSKRIAHDAAKCEIARKMARDASYGIIDEFKDRSGDKGVDDELQDMSRAFRAIASGQPLDQPFASYVPTARIARIISTAELMLEKHPNMTDAVGARVDTLIRVHVPRLLERHRAASETASSSDLDEVDQRLNAAIDEIRASVQEAAEAVHDEAMDALTTELRFLTLRRGVAPMLSAVA
jgi:hypothetical protein